jgi:hypothetical protein
MAMNFERTAGFEHDLKRLGKKYLSLEHDLAVFQNNVVHVDVSCNRKFVVLHQNERLMMIKARFFCKYLKGNTLRIVYARFKDEEKISFLEIFFKGDKAREDGGRIRDFINRMNTK